MKERRKERQTDSESEKELLSPYYYVLQRDLISSFYEFFTITI